MSVIIDAVALKLVSAQSSNVGQVERGLVAKKSFFGYLLLDFFSFFPRL